MPIRFVEHVAGLCLLTLILMDIFVTVLYARAGMQVYTALLRHDTVALGIDTWSGQTGDAIEWLARLFPEGQTYHFYPVLCYFRGCTPQQIDVSPERIAHARSTS